MSAVANNHELRQALQLLYEMFGTAKTLVPVIKEVRSFLVKRRVTEYEYQPSPLEEMLKITPHFFRRDNYPVGMITITLKYNSEREFKIELIWRAKSQEKKKFPTQNAKPGAIGFPIPTAEEIMSDSLDNQNRPAGFLIELNPVRGLNYNQDTLSQSETFSSLEDLLNFIAINIAKHQILLTYVEPYTGY